MYESYHLYWEKSDGTKIYHIDEQTGTPWRFHSYEEVYSVAQRMGVPTIDSRAKFEVVKL